MSDAIIFITGLLGFVLGVQVDGILIVFLIAAVTALSLVLGAIIRTVTGGGGVRIDD